MNVTRVEHSKKEYYCSQCGKKIELGTSYIWWKPRNQNTVKWHTEHGNPPKSLLTSSPLKKSVYEAVEDILLHLNNCNRTIGYVEKYKHSDFAYSIEVKLHELYDSVHDNSDNLCEMANNYYRSSKNVEKRFGQTGQYTECVNKGDTIYEWVGYLDLYANVIKDEIKTAEIMPINDIYIDRITRVIVTAIENLETFTI